MIAGFRSILIKFVIFALISGFFGFLIVNTMRNGLDATTVNYTAKFDDVSGLRVGDDVRVAGVRIGRVVSIEIEGDGASVLIAVDREQPLLESTKLVMRYQNLLGQRYLAMVQGDDRGDRQQAGSTIPLSRTSAGFDLTELLNGFRPLFEALRPADVNRLATSVVRVLQGEGGTVETLLRETAKLTNFLADRDQVIGQVLDGLTPVLTDLAGQGNELRSTVVELRRLVTGLAADRKSIGTSVAGMSELISSTSSLLEDLRGPLTQSVRDFNAVMSLFLKNKTDFVTALRSFGGVLGGLARIGSYGSRLNVYLCSLKLELVGPPVNLNGTDNGPFSEVCR